MGIVGQEGPSIGIPDKSLKPIVKIEVQDGRFFILMAILSSLFYYGFQGPGSPTGYLGRQGFLLLIVRERVQE